MKNGRHATEMDQLLTSEHDNIAIQSSSSACRPQSHYYRHGDNFRRRRRILLTCISLFTLFIFVYLAIPRDALILFGKDRRRHSNKKEKYNVKKQQEELNELTASTLTKMLPPAAGSISTHSATSFIFSKKSNNNNKNSNGKHSAKNDETNLSPIYECTSHLLIMRHCEKQVEISIHGEISSTDKRDFFGDRHCNARGKERSAYIATLFEDPEDYLAEDGGEVAGEGEHEEEEVTVVTPVPMVSSSRNQNGHDDDDGDDDDDDDIPVETNNSSIIKPLFPSPHKLYALSTKRDKHKNYREVETVEPLANKFHLDVDDRFGVKEEGDLATDFFNLLADSVVENVGGKVLGFLDENNNNGVGSDESDVGFVDADRVEDVLDNTTQQLQQQQQGRGMSNEKVLDFCNDGMTVVNWKHSRIPKLANALGCGKKEGCPKKYHKSDFDTVWLLTFEYSMMDGGSGVLEGLEEESERKLRQKKEEMQKTQPLFRGDWKISARVMNEGFDDEE